MPNGDAERPDGSGAEARDVGLGSVVDPVSVGGLLIHGEEVQTLGKAWGLNVAEATGAMSGAVLSPVGGFLMFGACSAL